VELDLLQFQVWAHRPRMSAGGEKRKQPLAVPLHECRSHALDRGQFVERTNPAAHQP
jgi:hypothetical protein